MRITVSYTNRSRKSFADADGETDDLFHSVRISCFRGFPTRTLPHVQPKTRPYHLSQTQAEHCHTCEWSSPRSHSDAHLSASSSGRLSRPQRQREPGAGKISSLSFPAGRRIRRTTNGVSLRNH